MAILDATGKEVKVGDKVAYATQGYMSLNIGVVDSFTTKSIRMIVGKARDWKYPAGDVYKDRILTRLPEQFVVIEG